MVLSAVKKNVLIYLVGINSDIWWGQTLNRVSDITKLLTCRNAAGGVRREI